MQISINNKLSTGFDIFETAGFTLPNEFWTNFLAHHWEQKPLLLKQPFVFPLADEMEIFECLIEASRRFRDEQIQLPLQFFNEQNVLFKGE